MSHDSPPDPEPAGTHNGGRPASDPDTVCPQCGTAPTETSVRNRRLSDLGYHHEDVSYECAADGCDNTWIHGVPVGSATEFAEDLTCDVCPDDTRVFVHRVEVQTDGIRLHLKCPACYRFRYSHRSTDAQGRALIGYPETTGELNPDKPYGYQPEDVQ